MGRDTYIGFRYFSSTGSEFWDATFGSIYLFMGDLTDVALNVMDWLVGPSKMNVIIPMIPSMINVQYVSSV